MDPADVVERARFVERLRVALPVSRTADEIEPSELRLCGASSSLVHVTVDPTATESSGGMKANSAILICSPAPVAPVPSVSVAVSVSSSLVTAAATANAPQPTVTTAATLPATTPSACPRRAERSTTPSPWADPPSGHTIPAMTAVVALTAADVGAAGALLAARHARERERFPLLPAAYEDAACAADLVREVLSVGDGVAAVDDRGDFAGFLTSLESAPDPTSPMARYLPERSSLHLVHGHAVAGHLDPGPIYAALFGELAARALERGVVDHIVHVPIGHPAIEAAWVALGFGRTALVAVRDLAPLDRPVGPDVEIRIATPDDLDIVDRLVDEEAVFHARSPIFRPYRRDETVEAVRTELATHLASDDHAYLIARRDRSDVGVVSIGPGIGSPLYVPDRAAYIAATAVLPAHRGSGAGAALVAAALAWARDHGYRAACLHFSTANVTSTSFWTGLGFTPVMAHLRRRLDERILTNRPPA